MASPVPLKPYAAPCSLPVPAGQSGPARPWGGVPGVGLSAQSIDGDGPPGEESDEPPQTLPYAGQRETPWCDRRPYPLADAPPTDQVYPPLQSERVPAEGAAEYERRRASTFAIFFPYF